MEKGEFSYSTRRKIVIGLAIAILVLLYLFRNLSSVILAASAVALIFLFHLIDVMFDVRFRMDHYAFIIIIAITGFLLSPLYTIYPTYDKILHFAMPLMFSSIVFYMVSKLDLKLKWKLTFTFFIVGGMIGIHEIGEYLLDLFFGLNLQGVFLGNLQNLGEVLQIIQHPLDDTMVDMSLGFVGALAYALSIVLFFRKKFI